MPEEVGIRVTLTEVNTIEVDTVTTYVRGDGSKTVINHHRTAYDPGEIDDPDPAKWNPINDAAEKVKVLARASWTADVIQAFRDLHSD
jgi:hypothetical protein